MIQVLLDKIGNVLEKDFLFGSFLPALLFVGAVTLSAAGVFGFEASLAWAAQRGPLDKILYPAVAALIIVVCAYALSALRPLMVRMWSGQAHPRMLSPAFEVLKTFARRDFLRRLAEGEHPNRWAALPEWLATQADPLWETSTVKADDAALANMREKLVMEPDRTETEIRTLLTAEFIAKLNVYSGATLEPVYEEVNRKITEWRIAEDGRLHTIRLRLDRSYGPLSTVRPTRIGNVIESYTDYSYTRYRIEPEVFWPHLQQFIHESLKTQLGESRTMLFFALSVASLAIVYGLLCLFVGPHLWLSYVWLALTAIAGIVAWIGYRVALVAAEGFGDAFRACFDMHRLDLLRALRRREPPSLEVERQRWTEVSRLVMYGELDATDYDLTPEPKK